MNVYVLKFYECLYPQIPATSCILLLNYILKGYVNLQC